MFIRALIAFLMALAAGPGVGPAPAAEVFRVGLYGDDTRTVTCVAGPPGASFDLGAWVYVPNDLGLAYVTLRLDLPTGLDFSRRPIFNDLVTDVIFTDFTDGTLEWNMLFTECPSGWIRIFTQEIIMLDGEESLIALVGDRSLARDCDFVLHGVAVANEMSVNDPDCEVVPARAITWGGLKSRYR